MARLSPSPFGRSRRLSELLEEQQEPFSLDLYLLEKGCSPSLLDANGGDATSTCWPRSSSASPALRRPAASKKTRTSGFLRLLLSKILRARGTAAAAAAAKKKKLQQPAAIDWGAAINGERRKWPGNFKNGAPLSTSPRGPNGAVEADMEEEEDDDGESSKQLSPVSVLEQRPFEQGPPAYAQKAMVIFQELVVAAYTPALLDQLSIESSGSTKSTDARNGTSTTTPAAPARTNPTTSAAHWEETFEAELAKVHDLIASEVARARVGPGDVRPERRDVSADVAAAVLEALTEEVAVELMEMGHDDAIDDGRWCW